MSRKQKKREKKGRNKTPNSKTAPTQHKRDNDTVTTKTASTSPPSDGGSDTNITATIRSPPKLERESVSQSKDDNDGNDLLVNPEQSTKPTVIETTATTTVTILKRDDTTVVDGEQPKTQNEEALVDTPLTPPVEENTESTNTHRVHPSPTATTITEVEKEGASVKISALQRKLQIDMNNPSDKKYERGARSRRAWNRAKMMEAIGRGKNQAMEGAKRIVREGVNTVSPRLQNLKEMYDKKTKAQAKNVPAATSNAGNATKVDTPPHTTQFFDQQTDTPSPPTKEDEADQSPGSNVSKHYGQHRRPYLKG